MPDSTCFATRRSTRSSRGCASALVMVVLARLDPHELPLSTEVRAAAALASWSRR